MLRSVDANVHDLRFDMSKPFLDFFPSNFHIFQSQSHPIFRLNNFPIYQIV